MVDAKKTRCALAQLSSFAQRTGSDIDEKELLKAFGQDFDAHATYARSEARRVADFGEEALQKIDPNSLEFKAYTAAESVGVPARDLVGYLQNAESIVGKDPVDKINQLYTDHLKQFPDRDGKEVWRKKVAPQIEELEKQVLSTVDPLKANLTKKYFSKHKEGGQLYGQVDPQDPFIRLSRNAVGNLVSWNPMITTLNVFEFTPKALAYAIQKAGPIEGTAAILKAMGTYFNKTGGKFWSKVPELETQGVYGLLDRKGPLKWNLLDLTENPLRGLSYYVGEALQPGSGREALEKIAFVNRFGNEPLIFLEASGTETLALMRYSISSAKMYGGLLAKASKGDVNSMMALAAFTGMTALQTGSASAIPKPIYEALPEDVRSQIASFDDAAGLNAVKKTFGTDLTEQTQPLAAPALGVGLTIASQDVAGFGGAMSRASQAAFDGSYDVASAELVKGFFTLAQLGSIPGVNLTSKKAVDSLAEAVKGEINWEDVPMDFAERTKLYQEPEF